MLDPKFFRYYERDWLRLPSVTTVLQLLPEPDWVRLWKERIGPEQYKIEMEWYGDRGTTIHLMCENYFLGKNEPLPTDPKLAKFVAGFNYFTMAYKHLFGEVLEIEWELFSEEIGIAWRFDIVFELWGLLTLTDWKTSTNSRLDAMQKARYTMQLSAYWKIWNLTHERQIDQAMIVLFSDSKKNGLWEVLIITKEELEKSWKEFSDILLMFQMTYPNP